jgi:hypothetical protein
MGWPGIFVLGAVIGVSGWWLHPLRRTSRARWSIAVVAGIAGASVARMGGNLTGLFHDGEILEWPVCTAVALIAVAVTVGLLAGRSSRR